MPQPHEMVQQRCRLIVGIGEAEMIPSLALEALEQLRGRACR
jgi:hypothetical protein